MLRGRGRGNQRRNPGGPGRSFFPNRRKPCPKISNLGSGPADCSIPELKNHYFDCNSYNEADRYITTKDAIVQYMGNLHGGDIKMTLDRCEEYTIPEPTDPVVVRGLVDIMAADGVTVVRKAEDQLTYAEKKTFDKELTSYINRKENLQRDMEKAFSIIYGQCSLQLQHKLKNSERWETISSTQNVINLLELIKMIVYKYKDEQYTPLSIHCAKSAFYKFSQGDMSLNEYRVKHDNVVQVAESYENDLWDKVVLDKVVEEEFSDDEFDDLDDENQLKAKAMARDRTLAISFIMSSDPRRYKQVVRDLENDFLKGKDNYPKDVPTAYKLLNEYRIYGITRDSQVPSSTNLVFPQHKERKKIACNSCGLPDYTIYNCPRCSKNRDNLKNALKGKDPQRYKNFNHPKNNSSHQKKGKATFA